MVCPNCAKDHAHALRESDACLLGVLLNVVQDRLRDEEIELDPDTIANVQEHVDPDHLWDTFGGPAADYVESVVREVRNG